MKNIVNAVMLDNEVCMLQNVKECGELTFNDVFLIRGEENIHIGNYVTGILNIGENIVYNKNAVAITYSTNNSRILIGKIFDINNWKFIEGNSIELEHTYYKYFSNSNKVKQKTLY